MFDAKWCFEQALSAKNSLSAHSSLLDHDCHGVICAQLSCLFSLMLCHNYYSTRFYFHRTAFTKIELVLGCLLCSLRIRVLVMCDWYL